MRARWAPILTLIFGALGILFLLGGPAALYLLWYRLGRDKPVEMVADYLPEPPDDLSPGVVGTLLDEQADMQDIIATLVDLAQRKVISITEEQTGSLLTSRDFVYRYENQELPVSSFEEKLLVSVFGQRSEVRLSGLRDKFHSKLPALKKDLYREATELGFFARSPEAVRNQYGCIGVGILALAALVGVGLLTLFGNLTGAAVTARCGACRDRGRFLDSGAFHAPQDRQRRRDCGPLAGVQTLSARYRPLQRPGRTEGAVGPLAALCHRLRRGFALHSQV